MLNTEETEPTGKSLLTIWIIWASMLGSLAAYVLVCHLLGEEIKSGVSPDIPVRLIKSVLMAVSAAEIVIAWFLRRFMLTARKTSEPSQAVGKYAAAVVISLAISESIAIYGLILFFIGEDFPTFYSFTALSAAAMIFYRPKSDEFERFVVSDNQSDAHRESGDDL